MKTHGTGESEILVSQTFHRSIQAFLFSFAEAASISPELSRLSCDFLYLYLTPLFLHLKKEQKRNTLPPLRTYTCGGGNINRGAYQTRLEG